MCAGNGNSLLSPLFGALGTLIESRHGLVGTANLQLVPVGLVVSALFVWTLHFGLVDIIPRALSSQDIFDFLLLHILAFVVALVDDKVVGAGEALEAVLADKVLGGRVTGRDSRDAQHVAACWAEEQHGGPCGCGCYMYKIGRAHV